MTKVELATEIELIISKYRHKYETLDNGLIPLDLAKIIAELMEIPEIEKARRIRKE